MKFIIDLEEEEEEEEELVITNKTYYIYYYLYHHTHNTTIKRNSPRGEFLERLFLTHTEREHDFIFDRKRLRENENIKKSTQTTSPMNYNASKTHRNEV